MLIQVQVITWYNLILSNQDNPLNIQVFVNFQQYVIDNIDYYIVDNKYYYF